MLLFAQRKLNVVCSERCWTGGKDAVREMFLVNGCHRALVLGEHVGLAQADSKGNVALLLLPCRLSWRLCKQELSYLMAGTALLGKPF